MLEHVLPSDKRLRCEAPSGQSLAKWSQNQRTQRPALSFFLPCSAIFLFVTVGFPGENALNVRGGGTKITVNGLEGSILFG